MHSAFQVLRHQLVAEILTQSLFTQVQTSFVMIVSLSYNLLPPIFHINIQTYYNLTPNNFNCIIFHKILLVPESIANLIIQSMKITIKSKKGVSSDTTESRINTTQSDETENRSQVISSNKIQKKSEGWMSFINEKLNDWPLWKTVTSIFTGEDISEQKISTKLQLTADEVPKWRTKNIKVKQLPWNMYQFIGRCNFSRPSFEYYHSKEDRVTYFFPTRKFYNFRTTLNAHKEILKLQKTIVGQFYQCQLKSLNLFYNHIENQRDQRELNDFVIWIIHSDQIIIIFEEKIKQVWRNRALELIESLWSIHI